MADKFTILYVDDEEENLTLFYNTFKREYRILKAPNAHDALKLCQTENVDMILADQRMPGMEGTELLARMAANYPEIIRILITGFSDMDVAVDAINRGRIHRYVSKPWEPEMLKQALQDEFQILSLQRKNDQLNQKLKQKAELLSRQNEALFRAKDELLAANRQLEQKSEEYKRLYLELQQKLEENRNLKKVITNQFSLQDIIGKSQPMRSLFQFIRDVARFESTVLILGESGTGKELVARAIHNESPRKTKPFVTVNCAALPENLLESELFGHEKGAFTGAHKLRKGCFERAHGGTIFLDEIGDISPKTQLRLLRVLQERTIQRVGGEQNIPVDIRIITATNQNLEAKIREGKFREDLYFRLNVLSTVIPPLRERKEDISLLLDYFLKYFRALAGKNVSGFSPAALQLLMDYSWPGNVRELQNAVERCVVLCKGEEIQPELLPPQISSAAKTPPRKIAATLQDAEKELILTTLENNGWNKHLTAKILKISRSSLYSKIEKYGLKPEA